MNIEFPLTLSLCSILRALQERIQERESQPCAKQAKEKLEWDKIWKENGTKWLLYACCCGSMAMVKLFIEIGCSPNDR